MRRLLFSFLLLLVHSVVFGQILDPVKWKMTFTQTGEDTYNLVFAASIEEGWTIYSQYLEEDGPVPTTFYFDQGDHFEFVGKNEECEEHRKSGYDKVFDMDVTKYSEQAVFQQQVKINDPSKPITGYFEFMTCDDSKCLPPKEIDFNFDLTASAPISISEEPCTLDFANLEAGASASNEELAIAPAESSGILKPVTWSFEHKKINDTEYDLIFKANIQDGWTIYSQHIDPDAIGPVPTSFTFDEGEHFSLNGEAKEEGKKKEGKDPLFDDLFVIKFIKGPVFFTQRVKVKDPNTPITGYLEFMTCDDSKCLPPTEVDFSFALTLDAIAANSTNTNSDIDGFKEVDQIVPSIKATYTAPLGNCGEEDVVRDQSWLWTFVLGFAGGLLALLTPCVFPMIPLTVSFFTKSSKDQKSGLANAIIYGLSIIVIYVSIGLIITGIFGPGALQKLATNWIANMLFFLIFVAFAFSFFGYYEITLPSSWTTKSDNMANRGGLIGIFFMAFTLALVSFSCTGPIIGSALVQSASSTAGPLVVMLGFSSALALPFGLFAAFPAWLNSLPKSGGWMNSVKVVLGFLELALALKFLSVADMVMHWNILPYEVFMAAWVIIFAAMTLYLFGVFRFPHDSKVKKLSIPRLGFSLLSLAMTIYLVTGFFYNDETKSYNGLVLMSGLAPPTNYNVFLPDTKGDLDKDIKAKYASFTKCANNLDCFKDYYEGVSYAKEVGKPIFLDFTGYGCVNCRKTEEHIWIADKVRNKLDQDFVLISLYTDDRAPLEEIFISKTTKEKRRNVGDKWEDFQVVNFLQNSQPLYVMMTPDEKVLAAPRGYKEGVEDYAEFLNCGLNTYEEVSQKVSNKSKQLGSK